MLLWMPCIIGVFATDLTGQKLSVEEADRIVREEMDAIAEQKVVQPAFTVLETHSRVVGNEGFIFNRVFPPVLKESESVDRVEKEASNSVLDERRYSEVREHRTFSLGIQVYDGEVSELIWRKNGRMIYAYSNIDFAYLTSLGQFENDWVVYSFNAFMTRTSRKEELERIEALKEQGIEVKDLGVPDLNDFSGTDPEYLIYPDSAEPIPDELFDALDALHLYYREHEVELKAAALKRESLSAAKQRYEEAHPEIEEPTVLHYWKIENPKLEQGR